MAKAALLWRHVPLAVRISIHNALGFLDCWSFMYDLLVYAGDEAFYAVAVRRFFTAEFGEKVVPDSEPGFCFLGSNSTISIFPKPASVNL